jgi:hypothetical protein
MPAIFYQCRTCIETGDLAAVSFKEFDILHGTHNAWIIRLDIPERQFQRWQEFYAKLNAHLKHHDIGVGDTVTFDHDYRECPMCELMHGDGGCI